MTSPAIPPPAPAESPSEPPIVKAAHVRAEAIVATFAAILGAVTDWIGIAAVWHLTNSGKIGAEIGLAAIVGLASGTIVAKMRGKLGGSTSAAIMTGPTVKVVSALLGGGASSRLL